MKKLFLFIFFVFSFFLFKPLDSYALNIYFYGDNYSNLGRCSGLNWCVPNSPNTANIIAIRVEDTEYQIIADSKYQANQTFKIWNKANNFSIRDDVVFYAGAIRPNTIIYNAKNSSSYDDFGQTYIVNYGIANEFTSVTSSTGYFYEYYFPSPMQISRFEIAQWDIINTGYTTGDIINNSTNTIINNNNENTQNIINSQDKINDSINSSDTSSAVSGFTDWLDDIESNDHGLSSVVTAPLVFIRNLLNHSCSPLRLELPFVGKVVSLPCMKPIYQEYFGLFFNLYQVITTGVIAYAVLIRIFATIKGLQDPQNDKIEVLNL